MKSSIEEMVHSWGQFFKKHNWQKLIRDVYPRVSGCGTVYELPNFLDRPNEGIAIVDMCALSVTEPHYHKGVEVYYILQGSGVVVVDNRLYDISPGIVVIIPSNKAHYTVPEKDLVMAVINTPPFSTDDYFVVQESNISVGFDYGIFLKLTSTIPEKIR